MEPKIPLHPIINQLDQFCRELDNKPTAAQLKEIDQKIIQFVQQNQNSLFDKTLVNEIEELRPIKNPAFGAKFAELARKLYEAHREDTDTIKILKNFAMSAKLPKELWTLILRDHPALVSTLSSQQNWEMDVERQVKHFDKNAKKIAEGLNHGITHVKLENLLSSNISNMNTPPAVMKRLIEFLEENGKKIQHLDLTGIGMGAQTNKNHFKNYTNAGVSEVVDLIQKFCPNLRSVTSDYPFDINYFKDFPHLQHIYFDPMSSFGFMSIKDYQELYKEKCPNLPMFEFAFGADMIWENDKDKASDALKNKPVGTVVIWADSPAGFRAMERIPGRKPNPDTDSINFASMDISGLSSTQNRLEVLRKRGQFVANKEEAKTKLEQEKTPVGTWVIWKSQSEADKFGFRIKLPNGKLSPPHLIGKRNLYESIQKILETLKPE